MCYSRYKNIEIFILIVNLYFQAANIIENMDITADPCDDFYRFACGGWMDNNVIPDGRNKWGRFYELRGAVDDALKGFLHYSNLYSLLFVKQSHMHL